MDSRPPSPPASGLFRTLAGDVSLSAVVAGFLAVLVSYAGPLVIIFQAAQAAHLSNDMLSSWIWAISLGSGLTGIFLSWKLKIPIITAWSSPGAALLVGSLPTMPLPQAIGAYLIAAAAITLVGVSGAFDRIMARMPKGIAAALLAGILFQFGTQIFVSIKTMPALVLFMVAIYLGCKRFRPRYAIAAVLVIGSLFAMFSGQTHLSLVSFNLVKPILVMPEWSWKASLSLALPLILVSLTGQYVPGMAVLRASGYPVPARPIVAVTGIAALIFSVFGAHGINLAAITAAICTGKEAHPDPAKRYIAGIASGFFYIVFGLFGGTLALLFSALPKELIATLAGLALIGAIATGLIGAAQDENHREASFITFLVTASGMSFLGLGAAFWGLVIGGIAYAVLHHSWKPQAQ